MTTKKMRLPKDELIRPDEGVPPAEGFIDPDDVEGHGLPTTAPPAYGQHGSGHGGEVVASALDDED
jgi:hypothetical protein